MELYLIIIVANLFVGAVVGLTGIAGFLLPMLYSGFLGMSTPQAMALSFFAFLISGILGAYNYYKTGNFNGKLAIVLSIGSFVGAILGVKLNLLINEEIVKRILYIVVLLSGISILLRKDKEKIGSNVEINNFLCVILGFITGGICALSGAGGPILVMPLLVLLGVSTKNAVGIALFNSIFIAIPSCIGYSMQCEREAILIPLVISMISHGVGVWFGSYNNSLIKPALLKKIVAVFSILIAIFKLITS